MSNKKKIIGVVIEEEKGHGVKYKTKWIIIAVIGLVLCFMVIGIPILLFAIYKLTRKQKVEKIVNTET